MGVLVFVCAVIMCGLIVAITNWWDNRKEKKEKEREASLSQDAAARRIMDESLEESSKGKYGTNKRNTGLVSRNADKDRLSV